jgi:hypothetical protein
MLHILIGLTSNWHFERGALYSQIEMTDVSQAASAASLLTQNWLDFCSVDHVSSPPPPQQKKKTPLGWKEMEG